MSRPLSKDEQNGDAVLKKAQLPELAVQFYTKALIGADLESEVRILGKRAFAYMKLKQYGLAIKDARNVQRKDPLQFAHYLRLCQVYGYREEYGYALAYLDLGLKTVKPGTDGHKQLEQKRAVVLAKQTYEKRRRDFVPQIRKADPKDTSNRRTVSHVPDEVVLQVFKFLKPKDILRCMSVSRSWHTWLTKTHDLFHTLDCNGLIPKRSLGNWIKRSSGKLSKVKLVVPPDFSTHHPMYTHLAWFQKCESLEALHLVIEHKVFAPECFMPLGLKHLTLSGKGNISLLRVSGVLNEFENLESLKLDAVTGLFRDVKLTRVLSKLKKFKVAFAAKQRPLPIDIEELNDFIAKTPNMEHIALRGFMIYHNHSVTQGGAFFDFRKWTQLKSLDLTGSGLERMAEFPKTLEVLKLSRCQVGDGDSRGEAIVSERTGVKRLETAKKDYIDLGLCKPDSDGMFPNLRELELSRTVFAILGYIYSYGGLKNGTLKVLDLSDPTLFFAKDDPYIKSWPAEMPIASASLTRFHLNEHQYTDEAMMSSLLNRFPNLEVIGLVNTRATGTIMRELCEREKKPRVIDISWCRVSEDIIQAARRLGIRIVKNEKASHMF